MGTHLFAYPYNAIHYIVDILRGIPPRRDYQDLSEIVLKTRHFDGNAQAAVLERDGPVALIC